VTYSKTVCGHCEDEHKPVTPDTGITVDYVAQPPVLIKISLHHDCAPAWCSQFGVPEPGKAFDLEGLRDRIDKMNDADLTRFETHARYMLMPNAQRPREDFEQELHEANNEWRRRHLHQVHGDRTLDPGGVESAPEVHPGTPKQNRFRRSVQKRTARA
jgi:hypothetical protein